MLLAESICYDCHNCEKEGATVVIGRSAVHRVFDSAARGRSGGPIRDARFLKRELISNQACCQVFSVNISVHIKQKRVTHASI